MAIQILRNEDANAINFSGSSFPSYYNFSLTASISSGSLDKIDVDNKISGGKEFFKIPYTDFLDATGSAFASAQDAVDYINDKANVPQSELLKQSSRYTQGYYGLLTDYFFTSGEPTLTTIGAVDVGEWIDVGFDIATGGLVDNRPIEMIEAVASGSTTTKASHTYTSPVVVDGDTSVSVTVTGSTLTFTTGSGFGITFEGSADDGDNDGYGDITSDVLTQNYYLQNPYDSTDVALITSYLEVVDGDRTITFDKNIESYLTSSDDTTFNFITNYRNVLTFDLNGLETTAFATFEGAFAFEPLADEGQVEARLLFQRRPGVTPSTDFDKTTVAGNMSQGTGIDYLFQPILTFFVGDTISTSGSQAGTYRFQVKSSVQGTVKMRQLTAYINT
jgi:hypothetical protein